MPASNEENRGQLAPFSNVIYLLQGDIGHDLTTINLLLGKHKTLETEILGHESTLQVTKDTVVVVKVNLIFFMVMIRFISVADPGCLSRIRIFPSRIQGQKDFGSRIRIRIKDFKYQVPKNSF
jgi:hypothetical protein